jgi:methylenetetrahydrofolate reductase (NADPH)
MGLTMSTDGQATTPETISRAPAPAPGRAAAAPAGVPANGLAVVSRPGNRFVEALRAGRFVRTAEYNPPRGPLGDRVREEGARLREFDAVNVTSNSRAHVCMASGYTCVLLEQAGVSTVMQLTATHMNLVAIQSEVLGAAAMGIRNLLFLTGDPPRLGDHPKDVAYYERNSVGLLQMVRRMRDAGEFAASTPEAPLRLDGQLDVFLGAGFDPCLANPDAELRQIERKLEAGAQFFQSNVVTNLDAFAPLWERIVARGLPQRAYFLGGVLPFRSVQHAQMVSSLPGVMRSDPLLARMAAAADPRAEGIAICVEIVDALRRMGLHGVHIMTGGWRASIAATVARGAKLLPPLKVQRKAKQPAGV